MRDLTDIDPHLALCHSESVVSLQDRAWRRFVRSVERLVGHDLDGDQRIDGYSLDGAFRAFKAGVRPANYAAEVIVGAAMVA